MGEVDQLNESYVKGLQLKIKETEERYKEQIAELEAKLKRASFLPLQNRSPSDSERTVSTLFLFFSPPLFLQLTLFFYDQIAALERQLVEAQRQLAAKKDEVEELQERVSRPSSTQQMRLPASLSAFARPVTAIEADLNEDDEDDGEVTSSDEEDSAAPKSGVATASAASPAISVTAPGGGSTRVPPPVANKPGWITKKLNSMSDAPEGAKEEEDGDMDDKRLVYDFDNADDPDNQGETGSKRQQVISLSFLIFFFLFVS